MRRDGKRTAGHIDDGALVEIVLEDLFLHRGGHQDQSEMRVPGQFLLQNGQQEIRFHVPFMDFIDDDMRYTRPKGRVL